MPQPPLDEQRAADVFAALGNVTRVRVLRRLVRAGEDGLNVGLLQQALDLPGSTLSHHLGALARAGLVTQVRRGREVVNRTDYRAVRRLAAFLTEECCTDARRAPPAPGRR